MAIYNVTLPLDDIIGLSSAYRSLELMASSNTDIDPGPVLAVLNDKFDLVIEVITIQKKIQKRV